MYLSVRFGRLLSLADNGGEDVVHLWVRQSVLVARKLVGQLVQAALVQTDLCQAVCQVVALLLCPGGRESGASQEEQNGTHFRVRDGGRGNDVVCG